MQGSKPVNIWHIYTLTEYYGSRHKSVRTPRRPTKLWCLLYSKPTNPIHCGLLLDAFECRSMKSTASFKEKHGTYYSYHTSMQPRRCMDNPIYSIHLSIQQSILSYISLTSRNWCLQLTSYMPIFEAHDLIILTLLPL